MKKNIQIKNGTVYDPANGIECEKMDVFIADGKIVDEIKPDVILDATDKTVMPGGIDVHSHVATYGLNVTRFTFGFPTVREIGYTYARMGYTHVNEPLMTLNTASYVHHELSSIPIVDTSAFLVLNVYDIDKEIREGDRDGVKNLLLFLLHLTKAISVKIYDARVSYAKRGFFYRDIDVTRCLTFFYALLKSGGVPGIQLRTYPELLDEDTDVLSAFCMAHIASGIDNDGRYEAARDIVKKGGAVDLGMFSTSRSGYKTMSIGHSPADDRHFISVDIGLEQPLLFSAVKETKSVDEQAYYSILFALEALDYLNACTISFSTDSPNGCFFYAYPALFAALLSRDNRKGQTKANLPDREYSLYELAAITRTNPARLLGLNHKGHLGNGADADVAVYDINEDTKAEELEKRLGTCSYLLKGGEVVIYEGKLDKDRDRARKKSCYFAVGATELEDAKANRRDVIDRICTRRSFRAEHLTVDRCFIAENSP